MAAGLAALHKRLKNPTCRIHSEGVPGKDCAMQLASKALAKKSTNKSRNCKGKILIETPAEAEDTLHQVTHTHTHTCADSLCTSAHY